MLLAEFLASGGGDRVAIFSGTTACFGFLLWVGLVAAVFAGGPVVFGGSCGWGDVSLVVLSSSSLLSTVVWFSEKDERGEDDLVLSTNSK